MSNHQRALFCHQVMIRKGWQIEDIKDVFRKNRNFNCWLELYSEHFRDLHEEFLKEENKMKQDASIYPPYYGVDSITPSFISFIVENFDVQSYDDLKTFFQEDSGWSNYIAKNIIDCKDMLSSRHENFNYYYKKYTCLKKINYFFLIFSIFFVPFVIFYPMYLEQKRI
ncbi:MAG: hypothetical protein EOP00_07330 [Pedobacter sp.]|nr:MAG: hypothetical protein EOP00_07330 [Pedobacter sp.]